jgi:hypothetical protein
MGTIVKIGDNRAQAEWAKDFYSRGMNASTLEQIDTLIANMPENGPIPYELKALYQNISKLNEITDYSVVLFYAQIIHPIIYGVEIDDITICNIQDNWFILKRGTPFIIYSPTNEVIRKSKIRIHSSTFYYPQYFTTELSGKFYINDKVFEINGINDLVYKDQFLIRRDPKIVDGPNITIIQPQIAEVVAENRHFKFKTTAYKIDDNITLINYNRYYLAECETLDENIVTVYAEIDEHYDEDLAYSGFTSEDTFYINDVCASCMSDDSTIDTKLKPGETIIIENLHYRNHYDKVVKKISSFAYAYKTFAMTEYGILHEITPDSGKHTKPVASAK